MAKEIELRRSELVWETRVNTWGEQDWNNLKNWMKDRIEKGDEYWVKNYGDMYNLIKDMSWDEGYAEFVKWYNDQEGCLYVEHSWSYGDGDRQVWKEYVGEFIKEQIREDNYDADVCNSDYADDYEEEFLFSDEDESDEDDD